MHRLALALALILALPFFADARRSGSSAHSTRRSTIPAAKSKAARCTSCARDSKGRIARSTAAKHAFQKSHPCPSTGKASGMCPGYVIDHVVPLKRGGADEAGNMQWQTLAAAKAKDKIE